MIQATCRGLPGAWINGWLAAVGATVLDARVRLHWTTGGAPLAVLSASEGDPLAALVLCGAHHADRVMVAGRWVVEDGTIPGVDVAGLIAAHHAAAMALQENYA